MVEEAVKEVDAGLIQHGWPQLPVHLYSYHHDSISSNSSSTHNKHFPKDSKSLINKIRPENVNKIPNYNSKSFQKHIDKKNKLIKKKENKSERKAKDEGLIPHTTTTTKVLKLSPWMKTRWKNAATLPKPLPMSYV